MLLDCLLIVRQEDLALTRCGKSSRCQSTPHRRGAALLSLAGRREPCARGRSRMAGVCHSSQAGEGLLLFVHYTRQALTRSLSSSGGLSSLRSSLGLRSTRGSKEEGKCRGLRCKKKLARMNMKIISMALERRVTHNRLSSRSSIKVVKAVTWHEGQLILPGAPLSLFSNSVSILRLASRSKAREALAPGIYPSPQRSKIGRLVLQNAMETWSWASALLIYCEILTSAYHPLRICC